MTPEPAFPLSRPVAVADLIRRERLDLTLDVTAAERAALAAYLGVPGVKKVTAKLTLRAEPGRCVLLEGRVKARLERICVVTLEPMAEDIDAPLRRIFEDEPGGAEDDPLADPDDDDLPDPVIDGTIDPGAVVCEVLALEMAPYPRRADAELLETALNPAGETPADHPFAALAKLRDGGK